MSKPGIAAVLSFFVPGLGQLYTGFFARALAWFVVTVVFHIGSMGVLGWLFHFASAYFAYRLAERQQRGELRA